jgi:hypothetical protein
MNTTRLVENEQQATAIVKFFPQWNMILFLHDREKFQIFSTAYIGAKKGRVWTCLVVFPIPVCFGWSRVSSISRFPVRERRSLRASNSRRNRFHATHTHTHTHTTITCSFSISVYTHCVLWKVPFGERESPSGQTRKSVNDYIYTQKRKEFCCWKTSTVSVLLEFFLYIIKEGGGKQIFIWNCL